jgi:superfamily II DNA helicase RecQ
MIAHDTTLTELATHKPQDLQALRGIKGFGPKKIDNYGTDVIDIVADHI